VQVSRWRGASGRSVPGRQQRALAALGLLAVATGGCVSEVTMAEARSAEQADSTIQYSAVRAGSRLFGDYSVVDRQILSDAAPAADDAAPAEDPTPAPSEAP